MFPSLFVHCVFHQALRFSNIFFLLNSGNFTNEGEGLSPRECIGKCCNRKACDLSFMFADLCYSVKCKSDDDCQSVVAKASNLDPKVAYVTRNNFLVDSKFYSCYIPRLNRVQINCFKRFICIDKCRVDELFYSILYLL